SARCWWRASTLGSRALRTPLSGTAGSSARQATCAPTLVGPRSAMAWSAWNVRSLPRAPASFTTARRLGLGNGTVRIGLNGRWRYKRRARLEIRRLAMTKGRLEAFTDGVVAIIITIMVLEIKVPQGADLTALKAGGPIFLAYALSYINVGIFWNNHHHMLHATERINGR